MSLKPCGTWTAARRHMAKGEKMDEACAEAYKIYNRESTRRWAARKALRKHGLI